MTEKFELPDPRQGAYSVIDNKHSTDIECPLLSTRVCMSIHTQSVPISARLLVINDSPASASAAAAAAAEGIPAGPPAHKRISKRVFNVVGEAIRIDFHYGDGRITASSKVFYKDGTHELVWPDRISWNFLLQLFGFSILPEYSWILGMFSGNHWYHEGILPLVKRFTGVFRHISGIVLEYWCAGNRNWNYRKC